MPDWVELGYLRDDDRGWSWATSSTSATVTYAAAASTWNPTPVYVTGLWNTTPVYVNTGLPLNDAARDQYQRMVTRALDREVPPETDEQREARLEREHERELERQRQREEYARQTAEAQRVREEEAEAARARRQSASDRASALLRAILTPDQIADWENEDEITVVGSAGGTFRVETTDYSGNIYKLNEDGETAEEWCVHPVMYRSPHVYLPTEDALITQVLALRTDEEAVRRTANVARY